MGAPLLAGCDACTATPDNWLNRTAVTLKLSLYLNVVLDPHLGFFCALLMVRSGGPLNRRNHPERASYLLGMNSASVCEVTWHAFWSARKLWVENVVEGPVSATVRGEKQFRPWR